MRLLALLFVALTLPAQAAGWDHYLNVRYAYGIDVPPGFVARGESANGDGQVFRSPDATLTVFGGNVAATDFESEAVQRERVAEQDGWAITYRVSTPTRASFSGKQGGHILDAQMIALCGGVQFAAFEFTYGSASLGAFKPIVDRLVASLKPANGTGC
jgi:hypothetical protein